MLTLRFSYRWPSYVAQPGRPASDVDKFTKKKNDIVLSNFIKFWIFSLFFLLFPFFFGLRFIFFLVFSPSIFLIQLQIMLTRRSNALRSHIGVLSWNSGAPRPIQSSISREKKRCHTSAYQKHQIDLLRLVYYVV